MPGTNFSVFSEVAERVELCLFDDTGAETRVPIEEVDAYCWHAYLPSVGPGHARAIEGQVDWDQACFGYDFDDHDRRNDDDSAAHVPKCVVHNPFFD